MSDWAYVAIAYTVVWASLAGYAILLARRVSLSRNVTRTLHDSVGTDPQTDTAVCDTPPAQ